jgi:hypothetical protein
VYIQRQAESILRRILSGAKVGIVLGARQVGKTTLVERVLADKHTLFLNLDITMDTRRLEAAAAMSPMDALRTLGSPEVLIVDEAQRIPDVGRIVKGWHDAKLPVKILLLGSSSLDLLSKTAESLTGRNDKLILPPLVFREALHSQNWSPDAYEDSILVEKFADPIRAFLMQTLAYGFYPEVVTTDNKQHVLRNLSSDYLWKDILHASAVKNPEVIKRLLLLLAHQVGSQVSSSELASQLQISVPTVDRYVDLLEQTYVVFRLPAFSTNPRKEICKSKKICFWDTGIRNALLASFSTDALRPDIGSLWENWVIAEIAKNNLLRGGASELYFWRSRAQSEVDLVVKTGDRLRAFEIKWRPGGRATRAFKEHYGVDVELLDASNPFVADRALPPPS